MFPSGRWGASGAALGAGVLLTAGLPPFGWWPLALLGAAVLAAVVCGRGWRGRLAVGGAAGIGFLAPGLFWMTEFSAPGYVLGVLIETALFTLGIVIVPATAARWRWPGFVAGLVMAEGLRGIWPFGGVPIATLAQTQIGGPLAPTVRLGGTLLLAALVAATGAVLAVAWRERAWRERAWRPAAGGVVGVALLAVAGWAAPHGTAGEPLRAALVQGGGERGTRAIETAAQEVYERHMAVMEEVDDDVDLVVWPEDIIKVTGDVRESAADDVVGRLARSLDATLVVGTSERDGDRFRVMSTAWDPSGEAVSRYQKNQRVPFGEYVPFRPFVERLADVSPIPRDALAGDETGLHRTAAGDLGVTISFEVFFPSLARAATTAGAEVLLVPTNATSYSTTQMPALTLGAARLRALETGRAVLQAAPTGFTAAVDASGTVRARSDLDAGTLVEATIERRRGLTPYQHLGDLPFVAVAVATLALAWIASGAHRRLPDRHRTRDRGRTPDPSMPPGSPDREQVDHLTGRSS